MRNHAEFLLMVLSVVTLFSFLTPDRGTGGKQDLASSDHAAFAELFNETRKIVPPNFGENTAGSGQPWLLAAKEDENGDKQAGDEEEEKDDKGGSTGFDRRWDVTCCG